MGREIVFLFSFYVVAFIHALLDYFFTRGLQKVRDFYQNPCHASNVGKRKMVFT